MSDQVVNETYEDLGGLMPSEYRFTCRVGVKGKRKYVLTEASAGTKVLLQQEMIKQGIISGDHKPGAAELDLTILTWCVKHVKDDGTEVPASKDEIKQWPVNVVELVTKRLLEMSPGLMKTDTPESVQKEIDELVKKKALLSNIPEGSDEQQESAKN